MMEVLKPVLTDQEMAVYKRGRNAKSPTMAKNATVADYRRATGFEALVGWLYLDGQYRRMIDLVKIGLKEGFFKKEKSAVNKRPNKSVQSA